MLMHIPAKVCQGSSLANEIIDQKIIRLHQTAIKYCWVCKPVVTISPCVRYPIQLTDATFERESEVVRQPFREYTRNSVHSSRFQCMNRQQSRVRISNQPSNRIHICNRKYVLNKRIRGYCIANLGRRIARMPVYLAFRGTNQHVREVSPPRSIKIPLDFAQVHAYIIRQACHDAISEQKRGNRASLRLPRLHLKSYGGRKRTALRPYGD